ncbi:DNA polymerase III subunit beta [Mycoplasma marinum]|uniref:Beta sliding clamp n=1 Tax=Mycoplasma marinum TaxID=1937190 RepID=A0A4R0XSR0_9MOLU|nr:DNA polymerase III subunit beta [Mycoplasma marinum]TCG10639.1 DNA polymerase III subunit beta [Mycoplasma marinum]
MNIKIKKSLFEKHLSNITKAITNNPALTSLNGILFKVTQDSIIMTASDGVLSIKETLLVNDDVTIIKEGTILIPGKMLIGIIKKQSSEIELKASDTTLSIYSAGSSFKLNLMDAEDYPIIDFDLSGDDLVLEGSEFKKVIKDVAFASSENNRRIILNGVNIIAKNKRLRVSATDSYRLATSRMDTISENDFNITILTKNIKDFIPSSLKGEVKIKVDESKINIENDSSVIQSRLIDGIYPELSRLIPKEYNYKLEIDSRELSNLIDKAIVVSSSDAKTVKLEIREGKLHIESKQEEVGNSHVETENFTWEGNTMFSIAFDSKFMKDALRTFSGKVVVRFIGELKPFVIMGESNKSLVQLVLPHRGY